MKLRLILFSSCTLLFCFLSSLSLNAQQGRREARLRLTTVRKNGKTREIENVENKLQRPN